jgi:hypothetical protein
VERERVRRGGTLIERVLVAFRGGERGVLHPVVIMEWDQTKGGHAMRLWMQQVKRERDSETGDEE